MIVVIKKCDGFCCVFEVNVEICTKKTSEFAARFVEGKIVQDKNKNKTTFVWTSGTIIHYTVTNIVLSMFND